jgi:DUF4097 and DUF4098 domain-containing protein YvlB
MKKLLLFVIVAVGTAAFAAAETKTFDSKGLKELSVHNPAGKLTIVAKEGPSAKVSANKRKFDDGCKLTWERKGDSLDVHIKESGFSSQCEVDLEVTLPKTVNLELQLGYGKVSVQGTEGELEYKVGSGDISAKGSFPKIDGKLGNGKVDVAGLTGGGEVQSGNGTIELTFARAPLKGEIEVKTGNGNATLKFPKATKLKTEFNSGLGKYSSDLGEKDDADFKVSMKSGTGSLNIKSY